MIAPYKDQSTNIIYNSLFCDDVSLCKNESLKEFHEPEINRIIEDKNTESRIKLLAYNILKTHNVPVKKGILLGIIVEVGLTNGLDTLAVFKDYTARYINHSEKITIWEKPDMEFQKIADELFKYSEKIIKKIGPWDKKRLAQPEIGKVRLTFLVSDGIYFGEGPIDIISKDEMGGPIFYWSTILLEYLVEKTLKESR